MNKELEITEIMWLFYLNLMETCLI